jgi:hypothetical protein
VRRAGLEEPGAFPIRRDSVDDAFLAGRGVQESLGISRQRPDVAFAGLEERRRLPAAIELVDLAVR